MRGGKNRRRRAGSARSRLRWECVPGRAAAAPPARTMAAPPHPPRGGAGRGGGAAPRIRPAQPRRQPAGLARGARGRSERWGASRSLDPWGDLRGPSGTFRSLTHPRSLRIRPWTYPTHSRSPRALRTSHTHPQIPSIPLLSSSHAPPDSSYTPLYLLRHPLVPYAQTHTHTHTDLSHTAWAPQHPQVLSHTPPRALTCVDASHSPSDPSYSPRSPHVPPVPHTQPQSSHTPPDPLTNPWFLIYPTNPLTPPSSSAT